MRFPSYIKSISWLLAIIAQLGLFCCQGALANSFDLVNRTGPQALIVLGDHSTKVEQFAASELQSYIAQITGGPSIRIVTSSELVGLSPTNQIIIGRPETNPLIAGLCTRSMLRLDTNSLGYDGYVVKTIKSADNTDIVLAGSNDRSSLFAVYHFLETFGVRFFGYKSHDGEVVPHQTSLAVPDMDIMEKPAMTYRFISDNGFGPGDTRELIDIADWGAKNRCNTYMITPSHPGQSWSQIDLDEVKKRGFLIAGPGHILAQMTPDEELFKTHPEYFPLIKGKRNPVFSSKWGGAASFCYSNPKAMAIVVSNIVAYYERNSFIDLLAIYPPDGSQHSVQCQCDECSRLTMSDRYLNLLNNVDVAMRDLPSRPKLMWISYNECGPTPESVRPFDHGRDFILVWCNDIRNFHDPMDSDANRHAAQMLQWRKDLKKIKTDWMENPGDQDLAPFYRWQHWRNYLESGGYEGSVVLLEYYNEHVAKSLRVPMLAYCQSGPWPNGVMQTDFEFYINQGITGWQNCTDYYNDSPNPYWNALSAQLMWNPSADVSAIDKDFYQKFYGPAGTVMQIYFTDLWQEIASSDFSLASGGQVKNLEKYLDEADVIAAQAQDQVLSQRLQEAHSFQEHCLELKRQVAENYNPDGSPRDPQRAK